MRIAMIAAIAATLPVATATAQDGVIGTIDRAVDRTVTGIAGEGRFIGGAGLAITSQPYAEIDNQILAIPLPLVSYQSERFEFIGKTFEAQLFELDRVAFSAVADWRFQGYDAEDSPVLEGMDDRSGTLELGVRAKTSALGVQFVGTALADTLSRHGGYELNAQASVELSKWRPLSVRPSAGVRYQSGSLADYYFGVDPEEARTVSCVDSPDPACFALDRPAFETGSAVVPYIGVSARQALSRKLVLVGGIQYDFLPSAITDSPIVDDEFQIFSFIGLAYAFGAPLGSEGSPEAPPSRAAR